MKHLKVAFGYGIGLPEKELNFKPWNINIVLYLENVKGANPYVLWTHSGRISGLPWWLCGLQCCHWLLAVSHHCPGSSPTQGMWESYQLLGARWWFLLCTSKNLYQYDTDKPCSYTICIAQICCCIKHYIKFLFHTNHTSPISPISSKFLSSTSYVLFQLKVKWRIFFISIFYFLIIFLLTKHQSYAVPCHNKFL